LLGLVAAVRFVLLSASLGHAAGESMLAISRRLGHSTPEFTAHVYTTLFAEQHDEDAARRGELLRPEPSADLASGGRRGK